LLTKHRSDEAAIHRLEAVIAKTLARAPEARLDEVILAQQANVERCQVRDFLVELVAQHVLRTVLFWTCPVLNGTALERSRVNEFPEVFECDICGQEHLFRDGRVELHFLPDDDTKRAAATAVRSV